MKFVRFSASVVFYLSVVCLLSVFPADAFSRDPGIAHREILRRIENKDYASAVAELEKLRKENEKTFILNNYDYLLARTAEKSGDTALAAANYQAVASRGSILKEYALRHLAQIARRSGNLLLERVYLQELIAAAPDSLLLTAAAAARLPRSFYESKDFDKAIRLLTSPQHGFAGENEDLPVKNSAGLKNDRLARENLVLLGRSYLHGGKLNEARQIFEKLSSDLPNPAQPDDFALDAAKYLDRIDQTRKNNSATAIELSEEEHLKRAWIYQFNRDFYNARRHYETIAEKFPSSPNTPDVFYQLGRGYALEDDFVKALEWFERAHGEFPDHPIAPDALSQAASAYARVNKPKEAVARYQKIIEKYPEYARLDRAYLNIVDVLRDTGADSEALKWTQKTQEVFRGKTPEAVALFAQARIRMSRNDWQNVLGDLEKLADLTDLGERAAGGTNKEEIAFLRGFALEQLNRFPEAIAVYLSIPDGRGEYYGWRATERLRTLAAGENTKPHIEAARENLARDLSSSAAETRKAAAQKLLRLTADEKNSESLLENLRKTYAVLPEYKMVPSFKMLDLGRKHVLENERRTDLRRTHRNIADELLFLGLYDEAAPELEAALAENADGKPSSADLNYTLAVFYKRGEMAHRAAGFIEPFWRKVPADYQIELMPPDQAELLYPAPYADPLLKFAPGRGVDPRFALAIMRQESRFRADVKSVAAARGLMQFISSTASRIAGELGRENFDQDELYDPPVAVLFGSQYLSNLFKQFPNQPQAVAGSYNGGENNIARWLARSKTNDPDRYVPEIVFSQTKDYVYKVLANYRVYRALYDENLKRKN